MTTEDRALLDRIVRNDLVLRRQFPILVPLLKAALADLDACLKALAPVAEQQREWREKVEPARQELTGTRLFVLTVAEGDAVLAAVGDERE